MRPTKILKMTSCHNRLFCTCPVVFLAAFSTFTDGPCHRARDPRQSSSSTGVTPLVPKPASFCPVFFFSDAHPCLLSVVAWLLLCTMKHLKGLFHGDGDKEKVDSPKNLDHFKVGKAPHNLGPLIVFVNPKSGGNQGHQVKKDMLELLGPEQVFDLTEGACPDCELPARQPLCVIMNAGRSYKTAWACHCTPVVPPPPLV